jgi:hypothetical protein
VTGPFHSLYCHSFAHAHLPLASLFILYHTMSMVVNLCFDPGSRIVHQKKPPAIIPASEQ